MALLRCRFRSGFQQVLVLAGMGVVALDARLVEGAGMTLHRGQVLLLVALEAEQPSLFDKQARLIGLVRVVA